MFRHTEHMHSGEWDAEFCPDVLQKAATYDPKRYIMGYVPKKTTSTLRQCAN